MKQITTNSTKETFEFAKNFAKNLRGGEIIGLIGDLGAGKTVFVKGLAKGLGIKKTITSPTFVLMKVYSIVNCRLSPAPPSGARPGIVNFIHIDAYRIKSTEDLKSIGVEEYFNRLDTVVVIEWADKIKKILPERASLIYLKQIKENKRLIEY